MVRGVVFPVGHGISMEMSCALLKNRHIIHGIWSVWCIFCTNLGFLLHSGLNIEVGRGVKIQEGLAPPSL